MVQVLAIMETVKLKESWREVEAWHYVAELESLKRPGGAMVKVQPLETPGYWRWQYSDHQERHRHRVV